MDITQRAKAERRLMALIQKRIAGIFSLIFAGIFLILGHMGMANAAPAFLLIPCGAYFLHSNHIRFE